MSTSKQAEAESRIDETPPLEVQECAAQKDLEALRVAVAPADKPAA